MLDIRGPTPPGIAFILAATLMWWGIANNNVSAVIVGGVFVMIGVGLQVLYLRYKYGRVQVRAVR
jgi:hypothetical protein